MDILKRSAILVWHGLRTAAMTISWPVRAFRELDQEVADARVVTTTAEQAMVQGQVASALMSMTPTM